MNEIDNTASRRSFIRQALLTPASVLVAGHFLATESAEAVVQAAPATGPYTLPALPYRYEDLEPHIDTRTMQIHHDMHHATYVKNLNDAVAKAPKLAGKSPEELIRDLKSVPSEIRTAVRNNVLDDHGARRWGRADRRDWRCH
jgi:Fe-Mn family superoxide dismutase